MPITLTTGGEGGGSTQAQVQSNVASALASQGTTPQTPSSPSNPATVAQELANTALDAGWVIILLGAGGYLLSETRIIGPLLSILLACATIFQLTQWANRRGVTGQGLL